MWVRQCDLDAEAEAPSPVPTRIASNEEFIPPQQTPKQKEFEDRLKVVSEEGARAQGMDRRKFLRTGSGMAAALVALNQTFGNCYDVSAAEVQNQDAFNEKWPKNQFIFDVQTHHIDLSNKWFETKEGKGSLLFFQMLRPRATGKTPRERLELLNRIHYVKEIFGDSDTVMAIISGVPTRDWTTNPLPPDQMAATRDYVNRLAKSTRVLSHGLLRPNLGKPELEEMERQVKKLHISAWKCYTGAELGGESWLLNDKKVAYPFWERTLKLGVRNVCVHKGLPLGAFNERACTPNDVERAALDFPNLNFIIYHSGYRGTGFLGAAPASASWTRRTRTRRKSPGSAKSSASCAATRRFATSTSSWAAPSSSCRRATRCAACTCSARCCRRRAPITSCGAPTASGAAVRRARSNGCGG